MRKVFTIVIVCICTIIGLVFIKHSELKFDKEEMKKSQANKNSDLIEKIEEDKVVEK